MRDLSEWLIGAKLPMPSPETTKERHVTQISTYYVAYRRFSMDSLFQKASRLHLEVQSQIAELGTHNSPELEDEITQKLDQLFSDIERLGMMAAKEPPSRKQSAKLKIEQLSFDCQHLHNMFKNYHVKRRLREQEEKDREELLSRRFTTNSSSETSIMIDHSLQHNRSLTNANQGLDELLNSGTNILTGLRDQGSTLKGVQKRVLDIANTLGLSNTVMRLISRRAAQDKWILFGGMIVTCIIMYLVVKYLT
ncbi:Golgi SNAP receptor complex member 2-like [Oscarella lobularis]|uniref:Golgi SNAP receptor complex member 2-like n=1 Tax=Oscarella lobularis TaxID=121494 RepID=UPI00331394A1